MKKDTRLVHRGRDPAGHHGVVNTPVYRASTVIFPTLADLEAAAATPFEGVYYGRMGTPTVFAFEEALAAIEGGAQTIAVSSGLAAITLTLMGLTRSGDEILVSDSVYGPTRRFCETILASHGVATRYYDPLIGAGIGELIGAATRLVFVESPGSLTFEIQDIPAIAEAAHRRDALVVMDNTWATPLYFAPFAHGVDVSLEAATKYIGGHADLMLGAITVADTALGKRLKSAVTVHGNCPGSEECYLGLRGLRSLHVRLPRHQETGLRLARWLTAREEVVRVLHPALESDPGHDLWRRDFTGSSGLFAVLLKPVPKKALAAMLNGMKLFAMGYSWGGYESLILPTDPTAARSATPWREDGTLLRLHAGLEDADDLIADLEAGFTRLAGA